MNAAKIRTIERAQHELHEKRQKKNSQARGRAKKLNVRIQEIKDKVGKNQEITEEERQLLSTFEDRRQRKNDRSRERAIEKKTEMERILAMPEKKRTAHEKAFLETTLNAKKRKNEGDRVRRQRIKLAQSGVDVNGMDFRPTTSSGSHEAAGPPAYHDSRSHPPGGFHHHNIPPPHYHYPPPHLPPYHYGPSPPEAPLSPTGAPPMPPNYPSPPPVFGSPTFPSPPPPPNGHTPSPSAYPSPYGIPLHPHQTLRSHMIDQKIHPDGSMTIKIGKNGIKQPFVDTTPGTSGEDGNHGQGNDESMPGVSQSIVGDNESSGLVISNEGENNTNVGVFIGDQEVQIKTEEV